MNKKFCFPALLILGIHIFGVLSGRAQSFVPVRGTYYGVFFEANGAWSHSSGAMTITTTSRGSYSAWLQIGLEFFRFSGHFDEQGSTSRTIRRFFEDPLTVQFQVAPDDSDVIAGSVSDGTWTADLSADRAVFDGRTNSSPDAGRYTMILPGDFTSATTPGGTSFATITIDRAGRLRVYGDLADDSPFFQATRVSKAGQWPFYFPAYWGEGSLHGRMQMNAPDEAAITGDVTWIKPDIFWDWYYPRGFAITVSATGSQYVRPAGGNRIIDVTSGTIEFNGGNLREGITNQITLDSNNRVHNSSSNDLQLWFSLSSGFFRGFVREPSSWDWIPFFGVVLQDRAVATGYFPGWDQTGEVWLQGD